MRKKSPTVREFVDLLENGSINMCSPEHGNDHKSYVLWYIKGEFPENTWDDREIVPKENIIDGVAKFHVFLLVFDKDLKPIAILNEYGGTAHSVVGTTVILLGKNGAVAYDKKTNKYTRIYH